MKHHRKALAVVLASIVALAGCSAASSSSPPAGSGASAPASVPSVVSAGPSSSADSSSSSARPAFSATLKLYHDKTTWQDYFVQLAVSSKQAKGVSLDPVPYSDQDAFKAFIRQSFQTSAKPDLFTWWTGGALQDLVNQGLVADTSSLWQQAIADGNATKEQAKYFTIKGHQYCVPLIWSPWVIYYNTKVFAHAGLSAPTSWDQLIAAAAKLKAAGITPFPDTSGPFSYAMFQLLLSGTDPKLYSGLADGSIKFTDPGVIAVMNKWSEMIKAGYFSQPGGKADFVGDLKNGKIGMEYLGTWFRGNLAKGGMTPADYSMILPPSVNGSNKVMIVEPGPLCSGTNSPNSKAASAFLTWMFTPDAQGKWSNLRNDVSFNPKAKIDAPSLAAFNQAASSGGYTVENMFYNQMPLPIATVALSQFDAFIADPSNPTAQLDKIQGAADSYWSQHK